MKNNRLKYKITLTGNETLFHGKKSIKGSICTINSAGRICITYISPKSKLVPVNVIMENCQVVFGHGDIIIHGFVRERGEKKFTSVSVICTPVK